MTDQTAHRSHTTSSANSATEKSTAVSSSRTPALLVLADGRVFRGRAVGATGTTLGEAVFTTALTGYQETLTDPSYHRQIIVATAPQIGNTGWNDEDSESHNGKIWAAGLVIRDLSRSVSNWRAARSLPEEMEKQGLIGIQGIDTRALVRHLRDQGAVAAGIFSGEAAERPVEEFIAEVAAQPTMVGSNLAVEASTDEVYVVEPEGEARYTVLAYDMGIKTNTPSNFASRGCVPSSSRPSPRSSRCWSSTSLTVSSSPTAPATPPPPMSWCSRSRPSSRGRSRCSASASATRSWAVPWAWTPTS